MAINPKWDRWIVSSVIKHLDAELGFTTHFESQERQHLVGEEVRAEIRVDGPYYLEMSKDYFKLVIEVNVLVTNKMTNDHNFLNIRRRTGEVAAAMVSGIPVNEWDDGESALGCLVLKQDSSDKSARILVHQFGQIDSTVREEQASVEAHYTMEIRA